MVPNTIPNMFMPNSSNPVVPNANPNMTLPNVSNLVVPNTMPNMVLPQVPTVDPNALPVAQPVYPLHHPFPLGTGGYSYPVALRVGLPVFFRVNVQGNVPVNVPVNVSVNEPAPRQFAPARAAGFRFDIEDDMPLTQVCESQVSSIAVNEPPTQTSTQTVDSCPPDENSGPAELPRSPAGPSRKRNSTRQSDFIYSFASEGPKHELKHEPEPKPKRRRAPVARALFDGSAVRTRNTVARAPFDGPALRTRNKGKNPFSLL